MAPTRIIHTVSAYAAGEVGDVIVGGVAPPPGNTLWEQSRFLASDDGLRRFMLNEPRGGVFRHINLLVPPKDPSADMGFIIMEPCDTPPMSGSNSICVATVLLETGILPMIEPETHLTLEAPGGLVRGRAACAHGKVTAVSVENLPSLVCQTDAELEVPELGKIQVDTAFGGDSFVVVNAAGIGTTLFPDNARKLAELGMAITRAADAQLVFDHPSLPELKHHSFCLFAGPLDVTTDGPRAKSVVAIRPGKIDRSPTGTAISARLALLHAKGQLRVGEGFTGVSIIGSEFKGRILGEATAADRPAIRPEITGTAWLTGTHQHMLDPSDPFPMGYRIADTWPETE